METPTVACHLVKRSGWWAPSSSGQRPGTQGPRDGARGWFGQQLSWEGQGAPKQWVRPRTQKSHRLGEGLSHSQVSNLSPGRERHLLQTHRPECWDPPANRLGGHTAPGAASASPQFPSVPVLRTSSPRPQAGSAAPHDCEGVKGRLPEHPPADGGYSE